MNSGIQHLSSDERYSSGAYFDVREGLAAVSEAPRHVRWWLITGAMVILLWAGYFAGTSALLDLGNAGPKSNLYLPRAIVDLAGILMSFAMMCALYSLRDSSLVKRALLAIAMALAATAVQSLINTKIFNVFFPGSSPAYGLTNFAVDFAWRIWIWVSIAGTLLAMSYAVDVRDRERRILGLQALAHSAQLRALRFQLNPHFLFNALNSIAGLISAKRIKEAETMTENLSDFLRLTLALDPQGLITLDEELQLQSLYLEIEKKRFPDRLIVLVDVEPDVRDALVPSLITQPLIENSVKYAIARSSSPVELAIRARKIGDQLELIVADRGGDAAVSSTKGAHLGLRNVTERISTYYGERGNLRAGAAAEGGFENRITVPLELRA